MILLGQQDEWNEDDEDLGQGNEDEPEELQRLRIRYAHLQHLQSMVCIYRGHLSCISRMSGILM